MRARWSVTLPGGELSEAQQANVVYRLSTAVPYEQPDVLGAASQEAVQAIGPSWVVSRGDVAGTYPKRLATYFRRYHKTLWSPELQRAIATIGATLGPSVNHGTTYHCDLAKKFNWKAGDYGDEGSCYWGERSRARELLEDAGHTQALRLYASAASLRGIGRCWVTAVTADADAGRWVVWNAYGATTVTFARILAYALGMSYTACSVSNKGSPNRLVWVNGGRGFAVHPFGDLDELDLDLDIDVGCPECDAVEECPECEHCSLRACQCGMCASCDNTSCQCSCCSDCEVDDRCPHCGRCNECGRA